MRRQHRSPVMSGIGFILLAEDDSLVRETVADLLELDGFRVITACDASEAMTLLRDDPQSVRILITDLSMPGENGLSLIDRARALRPDLPAILLTGLADQLPCAAAPEQGFDVLRKPVRGQHLSQSIKRLIMSRSAA